MTRLSFYNLLALVGMIGTILLVILWNGWLTPIQETPRSIEILLWVAPQLVFLYGVLNKRYYPHVYITFVALFYFVAGVSYAFSLQEQVYGYGLIVLSLLEFLGGFYFAYTIMKADKAKLQQG